MFALVACTALLLGADAPSGYKEARDQAARTPEGQVRLALWCEAHGLAAERLKHLAMAVIADPANAAARGLMGLVSRGGRWQRPEDVAEGIKADPSLAATLAEYEGRRQRAAYKADAQYELGLWCEEHGLGEQARAHLTAVIRLDPSREAAWKRLGYKRHEGRWVTDAQLASERGEAEAQRAADRRWKPLLEKWKRMLGQPSRREEAEAALLGVTDHRAVPSIGLVFATSEADQPRAAQLLGQVDAPAASKALAHLAVFAKSAEARRVATETLRSRDAREYADLLIALIRDPIKYRVEPVGGPGSPGTLFVEGPEANVKRFYSPPPTFLPGDTIKYDRSGIPVVDRITSVYQSDLPNVTGHSTYLAQGQVTTDAYGGLFAQDFQRPRIPWGLNGAPLPPGASFLTPDIGASGHGSAAVQRGLFDAFQHAAGQAHPPGNAGMSDALAARIGAQLQAGAEDQARTQAAQMRATVSMISTGYYRVQQGVDIPLAQMMAESRKTAEVAREQLNADVKRIEDRNRSTRESNGRVVAVLNGATGQTLPAERATWTKWWVAQIGFAFNITETSTKPTIVEDVPLGYQPQLTPINQETQILAFRRVSCFGAGTAVRTITGPRPIESIRPGDLVLTQSTETGALGYRPILAVHHNPPSPTFLIKVAGDTIVSSPFHRFWRAGKGWVMAREIRAGDRLRTLAGVSEVVAVDSGPTQLVYNLDVAEDADFFAGSAAALVHDNTLPDPRLVPFDAPSAGAVAGR